MSKEKLTGQATEEQIQERKNILIEKITAETEKLPIVEIKEILIEIRDLLKEERTVTAELAEVKPATSTKMYVPKKRVKKVLKKVKNN